jgi:SAM-dependent methyltransferase
MIEWLASTILNHPRAYLMVQCLFGANRLRERCVQLLAPKPGEALLDVGCGPGNLLAYLPATTYFGFDTHKPSIEYARRRSPLSKFYAEPFTQKHVNEIGPVDAVMLMGILHHLSDAEAAATLETVRRVLKPDGRVVTLDPCFTNGQNRIQRFVASNDRGKFVRTEDRYLNLVTSQFDKIDREVVYNVGRLPSTEIIMRLEQPRSIHN